MVWIAEPRMGTLGKEIRGRVWTQPVWDLKAQATEVEEGAGFRAETFRGWPR